MTRAERDKAIRILQWLHDNNFLFRSTEEDVKFATEYAIEALEQEPCEDCISRQAVLDLVNSDWKYEGLETDVASLPSVNPQKIGHCKDCKWWKDSDGAYRRGIGAESQCPMNRKEVYEGNGYCYMFKPQESEDE